MIDYTQWKRKIAKVSMLLLDPENPRIPPTDQELSQGELLAELIEHDKVYELGKRIAANGFYTDEMLITTPRNGKLVVVEGNRRLAALKVLLSPEAAPNEYQKKFRVLSATIPKSTIKTVPVIVAPSRDAALPRIAEKHTHSMLEAWKPAQQARFYRSLLGHGRTADDICRNYHLTPGELENFLRLGTLYEMACSLELPTDVQRKVESPRSFPITNLERLMESQPGRKFLGVDTDPKHVFKGYVRASEFKKGFAKIVTDVARGNVTSRVLNDSKSINEYLRSIEGYAPDKSKKGSFTPKDILRKPVKLTGTKAIDQKKTKTRRSTSRLIPVGFKCGVDSQRVHDVFNESYRLKVTEFPNAVAVMLRVLLELCVSEYIQRTGRNKDLLSKFNGKQKRRSDWYPSLRQQLTFMLQEMQLSLEPLQRKALTQFVGSKGTPLTLDSLDGFVHNKELQPTEVELRAIWTKIEPLMRIVLAEPPETTN